MKVLLSVLRARHPRRPAGHWVVMKTVLAGVDLYVMVYAWSQKRTCFVVSTCGKTIRHSVDYRAKFADQFDNTSANEYPRPAILHQLFHFLPLIDETNKERQSALALEKKWPTKNCWTRVITSLVGKCVVDLMRFDRHKRSREPIIYRKDWRDFDITEMADLIAKPLKSGGLGAKDLRQQQLDPDGDLVRIRGQDNSLVHEGTNHARVLRCFICRKYKKMAPNSAFKCRHCGMPLCAINRNRPQTCLEEHLCSTDLDLGCGLTPRGTQWTMPKNHKLYLRTRSGKRTYVT